MYCGSVFIGWSLFSPLPTKFAEADNISNIKFDWHGIIRRLMCVISNER